MQAYAFFVIHYYTRYFLGYSLFTWNVQGPVGVNVSRTDGTPGWSALHQQPVIRPAEQLLIPQWELISRQQMSAAHRASEALHVIDVIPSPHHQVTAAETNVTFGAFDPE